MSRLNPFVSRRRKEGSAMLVRDVMTYNVVTVPSAIPVFEAERLLESHEFKRLPVVDKGKLVGLGLLGGSKELTTGRP